MNAVHDYEVEYAVVRLLLGDEVLKGLIGQSIFPVYIDRDTEGDALYYNSQLDGMEQTKMGTYERRLRFRLCAVSWEMDRANRIIAAAQDVLEGEYRWEVNSPWYRIDAVDTEQDAEDKKYYKAMEFIIKF